MKRLLFVLVLCLVTSFASFAGSYDLYCLINGAVAGCNAGNGAGGSFSTSGTMGSATFSDFSVSSTVSPPGIGAPPEPPTGTNQVVLNTPGSTLYPGFYTSGQNLTATGYMGVGASTYTIELNYLVTNPSPYATDVEGSFVGDCVATGVGATGSCSESVVETVYAYNTVTSTIGAPLGSFTLTGAPAVGTSINVPLAGVAGVGFAPQSALYIEKTITLTATDTSANPLSSVVAGIQTFDQLVTPEPGFYGLLACGISALFFLKRKRQQD